MTELYEYQQYRVLRIDGRLSIWQGAYRLEGYAPATLAIAKELIAELCRCTVCGGRKVTVCRECDNGQTPVRNNQTNTTTWIKCGTCLGRGYMTCARCGGSGIEQKE